MPPIPMNMTAIRNLRWLILFSPLVALPFLLIIRWQALLFPHEAPKWATFILLGLILVLAGSGLMYEQGKYRAGNLAYPCGLTPPGTLFQLFFVGLGVGTLYSVNGGEAINRLALWCSGGALFWAAAWSARNEVNYPRYVQISISLSALLVCSHFWYAFLVDFHRPDFDKFVSFSLIGHFNFTADVLMVFIPLLSWTVLSNSSTLIRLVAGFALVTSAFMVVTSGSLGGMGGLLAGGLVAAAGLVLSRRTGNTRSTLVPGRRTFLTAGAAVLLMVMAGRWVYQAMPQEYRDQIFVRGDWRNAPGDQSLAKARNLPPMAPFWVAITPYLGSRTPMWAATAGMIAERPWLGHGTGSFLFEYPAFSKRYELFGDFETIGTRIKTNPHNVLLRIAAENGIPMAALFAGLYLWLTFRVMQQVRDEPNSFWPCGVWALWAAGLDGLVNQMFFNPASLAVAALGFGLLYGRLPRNKPLISANWGCTRVVALLAGSLALWMASFPLRWAVSEYYVSEAVRLASTRPPASPRHIQITWESARNWSPTNVQAVYGLATFHYHQGHLYRAESYLRHFLRLAPHHSAGLNLLANIQAKTGRLDDAETTLVKALSLEPDAVTVRENLKAIRNLKRQNPGASTLHITPQ